MSKMRTLKYKSQIIRFVIASFFLLIVLGLYKATPTYSIANHVVISEVRLGAADADDEFIELYNPTSVYVNLNGWRLTRKTDTGNQHTLVNSLSGLIAPHGYLLITPETDYTGTVAADIHYSTSERIAANNTILLYRDAGFSVMDKVGMGTATDIETSGAENPGDNGSIERKARSSSTVLSMTAGGSDEFEGNGFDSFNNTSDFVVRITSDPQNSESPTEVPSEIPATAPITLYAVLEGNNEVPGVETLDDGYASLTFNFSENTFDLNLSAKEYQPSDITAAHIHLGGIGAEGVPIVDLSQQNPFVPQPGNIIRKIITDMQFPSEYIDDLLAGNTYINLHTSANPDGEIRGQLSTQWPPPDHGTPTPTEPVTPVPTQEPTPIPTSEPTVEPTAEPTAEPTVQPTTEPTSVPTEVPTAIPTEVPTPEPTALPTEIPTIVPTIEPTVEPTAVPTVEPTTEPTVQPTTEPTNEPGVSPTDMPTPVPTAIPTPQPTQFQSLVIGTFNFPGKTTQCRLVFIPARFGIMFFFFPRLNCMSL